MAAEHPAWEPILAGLRQRCSAAGFDLTAACRVGSYNERVAGDLRLDDFGSRENLAIIVGNSRALWPPFVAALRSDRRWLEEADPLNRYTEAMIGAAVAELRLPAKLRWAHDVGTRLVAIQQLAQAAGLAYLSSSHLSVHETHGPWIGLRAAITFDVIGPEGVRAASSPPCGDCTRRCLPAFERACAATSEAGARESDRAWRLWLACRDACPVGREHRYSDDQIRYHYTKDREILIALSTPRAREPRE